MAKSPETSEALTADTEENFFDWHLMLKEQGYLVWDHPVVEGLLKHLFHVGSERGHCCGARDGADLAISCQPKAFHGKPPHKAFRGCAPADLDGALLSLRGV